MDSEKMLEMQPAPAGVPCLVASPQPKPVPLSQDPVIKRLRRSVGRFEVTERDRFVRIMADLDVHPADMAGGITPQPPEDGWEIPAITDALMALVNGIATETAIPIVAVGLAGRPLEPGEMSTGFDPAIHVCFDRGNGAPTQREPKTATDERGTD